MEKRYLKIEEAAEYINFSINTLYSWTSRRMIPHFKQNGRLRFCRKELDQWMEDSAVAVVVDNRGLGRTR